MNEHKPTEWTRRTIANGLGTSPSKLFSNPGTGSVFPPRRGGDAPV